MQFVDLKRQYQDIEQGMRDRITRVLEHGQFILGPEVNELEQSLAEFVGVKHAIGVANGTDALQLSLMTFGIGPGHAVFVPTFTFFATAEVVSLCGATPVFVDVEETSYNIDAESLECEIKRVRAKGDLEPRAVISVDLFGMPADYAAVEDVTRRYALALIEDGAQGFGGSVDGRKVCSFGDIATTSFFPAKPLACYGDGGAVFTRNDDLADMVNSLRVHGKGRHKYDNIRVGMNSRLDTIQAAILLEKLEVFESELHMRQSLASKYNNALNDRFITPLEQEGFVSTWAIYTIRPRERDRAHYLSKLESAGIPAAVYYEKALHMQKAFSHLGYSPGSFPVAEQLTSEVFSLPIHAYITDDDVSKISEVLSS